MANIDVENSGFIINGSGDRDGSYYLSFFVSLLNSILSHHLLLLFVCFPLPVHYYNFFLSLASALVAGLRLSRIKQFKLQRNK